MSRKRRKGHGEEHENAERWLLTYADMITLLMAFFIMMYSMSVMNLEKFDAVAFSIRSGFGGMLKGGRHLLKHPPGNPGMQTTNPFTHEKEVQKAEQRLKDYAISEDLQDQITVKQETRGLVISVVAEGVLFKRGGADLTPGAEKLLGAIAATITTLPDQIQVEGHTCPLPIQTAAFPSNWELSAARACQVVRFFHQHGLRNERLRAVGYADTRPRVANDSELHRSMNRRVDIVLLRPWPYSEVAGQESVDQKVSEKPKVSIKPNFVKVWDVVEEGGHHE